MTSHGLSIFFLFFSSPTGTWMWPWTQACLLAPTVMSFLARKKEAAVLASRSKWAVMVVPTSGSATGMRTHLLLSMLNPSCKQPLKQYMIIKHVEHLKYWDLVSFLCWSDLFCQDVSAGLILCYKDMPDMAEGRVNITQSKPPLAQKIHMLNNKNDT